MAYLVLARRYRPRRFSEVTGQDHVVRALVNAIRTGRTHHAYLFSGTRGVGKTTLARLLAKALNCLALQEGEPCCGCEPCRAIDRGSFPDLIEVDAASKTRVEETRELLESASYAPSQGRYKVYLIDEVHMLSHHSFNALLKTLEEPPEHVKFLLATTEPQKIPATVLSRCLQFHLKRLSPRQITERLRWVLTEEGVPFDEEALQFLAEASEGSLRDALSLADQAIVLGGGRIEFQAVAEMVGGLQRRSLQELVEAVFSGDGRSLLSLLDRLEGEGVDFEELLKRLLELFHKIALTQQVPEATAEDPLSDWLRKQAERIDPELLQLDYEIALIARKQLPWAPNPRLGVEMALLRMLAFRPLRPSHDGPADSHPPPCPQEDRPNGSRMAEAGAKGLGQPDSIAEVHPGHPLPEGVWHDLIERLPPLVAHIARRLVPQAVDGERYRFRLDGDYRAAYEALAEEVEKALRKALGQKFGKAVRIEIEVAPESEKASSRETERLRERAAWETVRNDPTVRKLLERFEAKIVSVHPREDG